MYDDLDFLDKKPDGKNFFNPKTKNLVDLIKRFDIQDAYRLDRFNRIQQVKNARLQQRRTDNFNKLKEMGIDEYKLRRQKSSKKGSSPTRSIPVKTRRRPVITTQIDETPSEVYDTNP